MSYWYNRNDAEKKEENMKRLLATLVIFAGFIVVPFVIAQAQGPLEFDHMQIDLWPEYDQPSTLVIYKITLPASTSMPAQVTLSLPKAVGQPSSIAMQDVDGMLYNLTYTTTTSGDWIKVAFTAPSQTLQVEYYDPGLAKNGTARSFQYMWPGDYKVNDMVMRIQQPINATQMTIQPTQGLASVGGDGLTYYGNDVGPVAAGTTFTFKISYTKPDDKLSVSSITVQSPTPVTTGQSGLGGWFQGLNMEMVVAIVGLVLIGGGVTWFFLQRRSQTEPARPRHAATAGSARSNARVEASGGGAIYCNQCGKRAVPGDVFCRSCGARLHI
jgi:hypothetical protein